MALYFKFLSRKSNAYIFYVNDISELVPYYQYLIPVFWEISLTKKVTYEIKKN